MKHRLALLLLFFIALPCISAEWEVLSRKVVNYQQEVDKINLPRGQRNIGQLRLKSLRGIVNMKSVTFQMTDGSEKVIDQLGVLAKGAASRPLFVPKGNDLGVKTIILTYDALGNQKLGLLGATKKGSVEVQVKYRLDTE